MPDVQTGDKSRFRIKLFFTKRLAKTPFSCYTNTTSYVKICQVNVYDTMCIQCTIKLRRLRPLLQKSFLNEGNPVAVSASENWKEKP